MPKKKVTPKKATKKTFKKKVEVSDKAYTKELKEASEKELFRYESHPFIIAILIILLILFITAAILSYISFSTTLDIIVESLKENEKQENTDEALLFIPYERGDDNLKGCEIITFNVTCDSQMQGFECELIKDNNMYTQWVPSQGCSTNKRPCAVNNYVTINAHDYFDTFTLHNRIEPDFYINRMIISYENNSEMLFLGKPFSQEPFIYTLQENTTDLSIHIVEILGIGSQYKSGLSEITLLRSSCLT